MKIPEILKFKLKFRRMLKIGFLFFSGGFLALFFTSTSAFLIFERIYDDKVYPGVIVSGINFGGKSEYEVEKFFFEKNEEIKNITFEFHNEKRPVATVSGEFLDFGYNEKLLASQAITIGRSNNVLSNIYLISRAYLTGLPLPASYKYSSEKLKIQMADFLKEIEKEPIDALFKFENGRVSAFRPSEEGRFVDFEKLNESINSKSEKILQQKPKKIAFAIPIKVLKPAITTESVNDFGIKELLAEGRSLFARSIPSRVFNITLSASRINGVLVPPGQVFSFNKALGDVSFFTGYQKAYVIKEGKTVLGDGGGVCQVSTTFFRALLLAGLPIVERNQHSYRVGYYEQDSPPGFDATIYIPSVDLKFKNDTGNYILIQTSVDPNNMSLTFSLYGTKDGREVSINKPVITNQTPPPPPLYQDDPSLPKGSIKQVDFEAWGAKVSFSRQVIKDGKIIISDKFDSNYQPWQAVYLRGTKE